LENKKKNDFFDQNMDDFWGKLKGNAKQKNEM